MYIYYLGFPLLLVVAVLDSSVMVQLRLWNAQPSLMIMVLVAWALLNNLEAALPWAVMGGVLVDILAVTPLGASSLAFVLMMIVLKNAFGEVGRKNLLLPLLAVLLGTVIALAVTYVVLFITGWGVPPFGALTRWILPSALFNFLGINFLFRPLGVLVEAFRPPTISNF